MNAFSHYARHVMAAAAALMISGMLMVNGLATSEREISSVVGILA